MYASVRAPGTCGELVQGVWQGSNFLVTCPINKYSVAKVRLLSNTKEVTGPISKHKACQAVRKVLEYFDCPYGAELSITSELPVGKGMASSTADLSAAAFAAALALGEQLPLDFIADLALSIEPSDGIFYPGIVMFDHLHGTICRQLGDPPLMKLLIMDLGGEVDTVYFNKQKDLWSKNLAKENKIKQAVELIEKGIKNNSPKLIGEAASISSIANQNILYKHGLEDLLEVVLKNEGYGINIAHSGTVIGVLLDKEDDRLMEWQYLIRGAIKERISFYTASLIGGGVEPLEIARERKVWCT